MEQSVSHSPAPEWDKSSSVLLGEHERQDQHSAEALRGKGPSTPAEIELPEGIPHEGDWDLDDEHDQQEPSEIAAQAEDRSDALKGKALTSTADHSQDLPAMTRLMLSGALDFLYYEAHGPAHALELMGYGWSNTRRRGKGKSKGKKKKQ